jgi:purine-binding chemotaxis protein CheW
MAERRQFCTFILDRLYLGLDVLKVQEILRHREMTRVPLAPRQVSGLMNIRGQIVTTIDLRRRLELDDRPADQLPINVVVASDDGPMSLLVDEIGDVVEVDEETFESCPDTLQGTIRELIRGVYKLPDSLLLVLDVDRAVQLGPASNVLPASV